MTEENETNETTEESETKATKVRSLMADVAQKIAGSNSYVYDRLVGSMVDEKVSERVSVLTKAFQKRSQLAGELKGIKPDNVSVDKNGAVLSEGFSPAKQKALKKATDSLNSLHNAMESCLTSENAGQAFDKLTSLLKKLN